jgi:hypothetical protein
VSIDQTNVVDLAAIDKASGDLWLTIADHLPWDENEGDHSHPPAEQAERISALHRKWRDIREGSRL